MAESVIAQQPQRFYCHKCNVEIENVSSVSLASSSYRSECTQSFRLFFLLLLLFFIQLFDAMEMWLIDCAEFHLNRKNFSKFVSSVFFSWFLQEFTCPLCAGGFIEELPPNGSYDRSRNAANNDDVEIPGEFGEQMNERISSFLMSSGMGNLRSMDEDGEVTSTHDGPSSTSKSIEFHCPHFSIHITNDKIYANLMN